ncbi:MAG: biotin--[acetyl-CoA-carboxylase] ligase [Legionellaceae bacterium]|nr:biotin--[acetyl-CoA-carboxylase] ligase [Legionellaceae bacterium]
MDLSSTQRQILQLLGETQHLSGTQLAARLGISRTAVWKQIQKLNSLGIAITRQNRQGYRLPEPLILLDATSIRRKLSPEWLAVNPVLYLPSIVDSTNLFLKDADKQLPWAICCSEQQLAGRGRLGRPWNSPFGHNIYCSVNWRYEGSLHQLSGLSLAVSLALHQALSAWVQPEVLQIKWPNDLLWQGKKIAGILIEISAEPHGGAQVIIGFGININTHTPTYPLSDAPHCSLRDIKPQYFDRNPIVAQCLNQLYRLLSQFEQQGLNDWLPAWQQHDALYGKAVTIYQQQQQIEGIARGISPTGNLLLEIPSGQTVEITVGDASLKP